jgi:hypothetical protein
MNGDRPLAEERLPRLLWGLATRWPWAVTGLLLVLVAAVCGNGATTPAGKRNVGVLPRADRAEWTAPDGWETPAQGIHTALTAASAQVSAGLLAPEAANALTVPPTAASSVTVRAWQPADECSRLTRPVSRGAMRWCGYVALRLHQYGDWDAGDLTKLMRIMDCESGGNPLAKNPGSSASGLFQFLNSTFARWGPRAAAYYGFDHPGVFYGFDNVSAAVLLFEAAGPGPWPNCGRR